MNTHYSTSSQNKKAYNPKLGKLPDAVYIPSWLLQIPCSELSYQAKILYGRLAQWVNQNGLVYRSAKQLTHELGMSHSSVERTLKELRDVGLIGTYQTCSGGVNHYVFYEHNWMYVALHKNLQYLGQEKDSEDELSTVLVDNPVNNIKFPPPKHPPTPPHNWGDPHPTTGGINKGVKKACIKEASYEASFNNKKLEKTNSDIRLPASLESMQATLNIQPAGILKLMGIAKNQNQRLQDVWLAKKQNLLNSGATEGRAFHYVKFLLETGEDFAYRAQFVEFKKNPLDEKKSKLGMDFINFRNKRFVRSDGFVLFIHNDGSADVTQNGKNSYVRPADVPQFYAAIEAGRLKIVEEYA